MEYRTYKRISDNTYIYVLGDHPLYYVKQHDTEKGYYKISSSPDSRKSYVITKYMLNKYFTPTVDSCRNIFKKTT